MKKTIALTLWLSALSMLGWSCFREEDFNLDMLANKQDVDYDVALPLFETRLTIANLLSVFGQSENFPTGEDGLVHLVYALPEPLRFDIGEQIKLPSIAFEPFEINSVPYWKHDTVITVSTRDTIGVDIQGLAKGASITKIALDSLDIFMDGAYTVGMATAIDLVFVNLLQNGKPLEIHLNLEKGSGVSYSNLFEKVELVLDGELRENPKIVYETRLRGDMNTAENEFPDVRTGKVQLRPKFNKIVYSRIEGYIGQFDIKFKDALDVSLLQNLDVEEISFYGGTIDVTSTLDGCSVPIYINQSQLVCHFSSEYPSEQIAMFPEKYTLPYPEPTASVLSKTSTHQINIHELLSHKPKAFDYLVDATLNGGEAGEQGATKPNNIIERSSGLDMNITCDLPLHMAVKRFILDDTMAFNSIEQADMIKRFYLKGIVTNAFPLEVYLHLDFLDEDYNVLFSPVSGDTIQGGRVNENLHVEEPGYYRLDAELSSDELAKLKQTRFIRVWANISTYNKGEAKIYADSDKEGYLRVKLGARATVRAGGLIGGQLK